MRSLLPALALTLALAGCTTYTYRWDGKTYRSSEQALAAARSSYDAVLARVPEARDRVGGTLNFHVPDRRAILERGIKKTGSPQQRLLDYIADAGVIGYRGLYDALVKRGTFDRVLLHYSDGGHVPPRAGQFVLYIYRPNPDTEIFYLLRDGEKREAVQFDNGSAERTGKVLYWLDNVDTAARRK